MSAPLFAVSVTAGFVMLSTPCGGTMTALALWGLGIAALASVLTAGHCLGVLLLPQAYVKEQA